MKKGIYIIAGVVLVLLLIFFIDNLNSKSATRETAPAAEEAPSATTAAVVPNDLPMMSLTRLDGSSLMAKDLEGKTVLVLFRPDCDHCQRETVQIRENLEAFEDYTIYFVSDAGLPQLSQFAREYDLADKNNIYFAQASVNDIIHTLGPVEAPSVFIYSEEGRLVGSFIGETPIEEIISAL
ncbi:TlpA family protein disulfide reductase [Pontibacter pamirensis]|uniref:TlpA family protein disulfide reductase n=1 Tax=Pontibacter pamirensis TaxID=2562824 RepID=UPI0013895A36|nr:redoxin domain-containing protein [Pontibacter pamirensis]